MCSCSLSPFGLILGILTLFLPFFPQFLLFCLQLIQSCSTRASVCLRNTVHCLHQGHLLLYYKMLTLLCIAVFFRKQCSQLMHQRVNPDWSEVIMVVSFSSPVIDLGRTCITVLANERREVWLRQLLGKVFQADKNRHKKECHHFSAAEYLQTGSRFRPWGKPYVRLGWGRQSKMMERTQVLRDVILLLN